MVIAISGAISKSTKDEFIPLDATNKQILDELTANIADDALVFTDEAGQPFDHNTFICEYYQVCHSAGIPDSKVPTPHVLRAQFAHDLDESGYTTPEIQLLMRHQNIQTTGMYLTKAMYAVYNKFRAKRNEVDA